ncbi:hypothetical protein Tco_1545907 [Tanacetum coccineum]
MFKRCSADVLVDACHIHWLPGENIQGIPGGLLYLFSFPVLGFLREAPLWDARFGDHSTFHRNDYAAL